MNNLDTEYNFKVQDRTWKDSAKEGLWLGLKIVLFPWGLCEALRYTAQRMIMTHLYPAQSNLQKRQQPFLQKQTIEQQRIKDAQTATREGLLYKNVTLERNGTRYSGLLISEQDKLKNGNWVLQATGNMQPVEQVALQVGKAYLGAGFNTLLVNGPNVGSSEGHATPHSMGEAQETAIRFLETEMEAKKIALAGFSIGRSAIGQAILQHDFKPTIQYLGISQMAFDTSSNVVKKIVKQALPNLKYVAQGLIQSTGLEMNNVASSKKLTEKGISEIVIQSTHSPYSIKDRNDFRSDGVIPAPGTLGYRLFKNQAENKTYIPLPQANHNDINAFVSKTVEALKNPAYWDSRSAIRSSKT